MAKSAKATSVSATFGYDTMNVMGFNLYTVKLRVNQFDLLRCFIEYKRDNDDNLRMNLRPRLVESKNGKVYAYYEYATTVLSIPLTLRERTLRRPKQRGYV